MLGECCGAVFVATPDDCTTIGDKTVSIPRSNVMLEFGLVAGRMGRHSTALCRYGGAVLPSDLKGLTDIPMDPCSASGEQVDAEKFRDDAEEKLRHWCKHLLATAETVPRTDIVHGYTGSWDFNLQLRRWRCLEISPPSFVQVHGSFDPIHSGRRTSRTRVSSGTCVRQVHKGWKGRLRGGLSVRSKNYQCPLRHRWLARAQD